MTPIFSINQSQCARFTKSVVTLLLSFKRVTTSRNLLIDSHRYKRHKKNIPTAFHSLSLFTLITIQLNPLFLKTFNYSKTIQRLALSFRNLHSFHWNATKNVGNFLVRSSFQTNDQPGTFKCARARCKTCPFIHNANKISGLHVHLRQRHLLYNLHLLQKDIHWRNRTTTRADSENTFGT